METFTLAPRLDGEPFVAVDRGGTIESIHRVAACAVDAEGAVALARGTIDTPVFLRSAAKPFIAAAAVRAGIVERFGLERREIAVMAGSHNGETFHIDAVRSILAKVGLTPAALQCGPHPPYDDASARELIRQGRPYGAIHNNCSGKHAGILALCTLLGADTSRYTEVDSPAQQLILELCARLLDQERSSLPLAVDGCGIPVFATSLRRAALAFSRFATLRCADAADARALETVREAMLAFPEYVSGTGEFDAALVRAAHGGLAAKAGAEAVHATAVISAGIGLVVKVVDGGSRAVAPAVVALLGGLGLLYDGQRASLAPWSKSTLYNRAGTAVGSVEPIDSRQTTKRST